MELGRAIRASDNTRNVARICCAQLILRIICMVADGPEVCTINSSKHTHYVTRIGGVPDQSLKEYASPPMELLLAIGAPKNTHHFARI